MAKIYVAGKNLDRARLMINILTQNSHTITYDWVKDIETEEDKDLPQRALDERAAVQLSDILIYLWEPDQESARYEAGMAMGLNKPIIVSGFNKKLFFLGLPEVTPVKNDAEIINVLNSKFKNFN